MKIALLWIGKTRDLRLQGLIQEYCQRVGRFCEVSLREVASVKNDDQVRLVYLEGEKLLAKVLPSDFVVLLDVGGKSFTSEKFAAFIAGHRDRSSKPLVFVIGGHEGASEQLKRRANQLLSLSPMTFTHEMARCLLAEQIYRAFSILNCSPYHKI